MVYASPCNFILKLSINESVPLLTATYVFLTIHWLQGCNFECLNNSCISKLNVSENVIHVDLH